MKLKLLTVLLILSPALNQILAQDIPAKFGKIEPDVLRTKVCPIDSNAHAYYIFDTGTTEFRYDMTGSKGFQLFFNRHLRIKILDNEGLSLGDFNFPLYHDANGKEEVTDMKAVTYNLEDEKIIRTKLEKKTS